MFLKLNFKLAISHFPWHFDIRMQVMYEFLLISSKNYNLRIANFMTLTSKASKCNYLDTKREV